MSRVLSLNLFNTPHLMCIKETPTFSWISEGKCRNLKQTAYRLIVSENEDLSSPVYDSGVVMSDSSVNVQADFPLKSCTKYYAAVNVFINGEDWGFSPVTDFLTGFLDNDQISAKFMRADEQNNGARSNGHYIRKEFTLKKPVKSAYLYSTALGVYKLYLNGQSVGDAEMAPGWTSYKEQLLYQAWDVTKNLNTGANALAAHVGAGWYKGEMGFNHTRNNYGDTAAFLLEMHVTYQDGTADIIITDNSWKTAPSPVLFSEIYDGEIYDANLEQPGWDLPGFDDSSWEYSDEVSFSKNPLTPQSGACVRFHEAFPAKELFTTPNGETCVDFGQNLAGRVSIKARGKKGDEILLRMFETLDKDGNVYLLNLRQAKAEVKYLFAHDGEIEFTPFFTFHGFRYAWIVKCPGTPRKEDFVSRALYSDMPDMGSFTCSHPLVNQLVKNVRWSLKSNFVDIPTDCPQRDERVGWTGDAQIFSRTACYLNNAYLFYEKWLRDLYNDQKRVGGVPHIVPDIITGFSDGDWLLSQGTHSASAWSDAAVIIPWNLYLMYGSTDILRKQFDSMRRWIDFMDEHAVNNIWNYKLQFGDWVALDAEEGSYYGATPNDLVCTAYYAYSTRLFAKICGILDKKEEQEKRLKKYEEIRSTFLTTFYNTDGTLNVSTQTAHIVALHFDLVEEKNREKIINGLIRLLEKENGHLVTGFVGTPYFCHALSNNGRVKEAYDLLLKEDFPSWLYQVKMGATTIWEHWDGIKPDGSMWSPDMNSLNHYAYGAVAEWLFRTAGGLDTREDGPAFKKSIIYPRIGAFTQAETKHLSPYGQISISYEIRDNIVTEKFRIPVNTEAEVRLFKAAKILDADGLDFSEGMTAAAGSGEYTIRYELAK